MKRTINKIAVLACMLYLAACGKDNYDEPSSVLSGRVTYKDEPIGVRGSNESVRLQLWQDGYPVRSAIDVYVTQDGSFTSTLFNGTYKLVSTSNNGPWVSKQDTVVINVNGATSADYPVTPYYTISKITYNLTGNILKASFDVAAVDESRNIEFVTLMVNDTKFVDIGQHSNTIETAGVTPGHVELELDVSDQLATGKPLFARVGVKVEGVTEAVYDPQTTRLQ